MPRPQLLFGGAIIGGPRVPDLETFKTLANVLSKHNVSRIDTAALYPSTSPGRSEELIGQGLTTFPSSLAVDTKILTTSFTGEGTLSRSAIQDSVNKSKQRLAGTTIHTLYCHTFDPTTPLPETAATLEGLLGEGFVKHLGISNFPAARIHEFVTACEDAGCPKPKYYEGLYNALSRGSESSGVLEAVREYEMGFIAYSPLAGGFLTGKFTNGQIEGTRFADPRGQFYKGLYDKVEMHEAVKLLESAVTKSKLDQSANATAISEAALRWLYWHSALNEQDGLILGAANIEQLDANCVAIEKGPLPEQVVQAFENAWKIVERVAPPF